MAPTKIDWPKAILPLIDKYRGKKHPLNHKKNYQLLAMVVLSAQSRDDVINRIAPAFFAAYPDMPALAKADPQQLFPYLADKNIPLTLDDLVELPGIGRKSANVILREAGRPPEGVIVDVHVVRVAPRLGIVKEDDPGKMEEKLMKILPREEWDAGMAMSFLGREICTPTPQCERCLMNPVCSFYARVQKKAAATGSAVGAAAKKSPAKKPAAAAKKSPQKPGGRRKEIKKG
jgi:endonuclease-3